MQPDVQLSLLTAGGLEEPRADWTEAAERNIAEALANVLAEKHDELLFYQPPVDDPEAIDDYTQLVKLHEAVGETILIHKYLPGYQLPTKVGRFDWTLGDHVKALREQHGADYALFLYIRDSYTSAGRAAIIGAAALFGVSVQGGVQLGFASLIDLRNGQVVWFNRLLRGVGDLRTREPAVDAVNALLAGIPL
jgi:hypothetical protein